MQLLNVISSWKGVTLGQMVFCLGALLTTDFTPSSCSYAWVPPFCGPLQSVCLFLKSFLTLCRQEISYTFSLCSPFSFQPATENLEGDHKIAGDPGQDIAWVSGFWLSKPGDR